MSQTQGTNVLPFKKETSNIEALLELLAQYKDLFLIEGRPNAVTTILFSRLWDFISLVKDTPAEEVEAKTWILLNPYLELVDILGSPVFGNPTFEDLKVFKKTGEHALQQSKDLRIAEDRLTELAHNLESEKQLSERRAETIKRLKLEADNIAERMYKEICDPGSSIFQAMNRVNNSVKSLENAQATLSGVQNNLTKEIRDFSESFNSNIPAKKSDLSGSSSSVKDLENELQSLYGVRSKVSKNMEKVSSFIMRIENRIIPRLELLKTHTRQKNVAGRLAKFHLAVMQAKSYSQQLVELERVLKARYVQKDKALRSLREIIGLQDEVEFIIPNIPELVIDFSNVQIPQVEFSEEPVKERDHDQIFLNSVLIPVKPFLEVAARTGLTTTEILFCTLYDLIPGDYDKHESPTKELTTLIWAASRSGIIKSSKEVVNSLTLGWWGRKETVYKDHPKIMPYLICKRMALPRFQRTVTTLPWRPLEVISHDFVRLYQNDLRQKFSGKMGK